MGFELWLLEGFELIGDGVTGDKVGDADGVSVGESETSVGCTVGLHLQNCLN